MELTTSRPLLLDMIVKTIDRLVSRKISAGTLYQVFTDTWVTRDVWRNVLSTEEKQSFLFALAIRFWQTAEIRFHYLELLEYLKAEFAAKLRDYRSVHEVDHEIRTASFLTRDTQGNYGFAHKSYAEFFLAQYLSRQVKAKDVDCLSGGRLTPEVASFMRDLLTDFDVTGFLETILVQDYRPVVSENALLILYCLRLNNAKNEAKESSRLVVRFPEGMKLAGAQLSQMNLERSSMQRADLQRADFSQSVLRGADLSGALLGLSRLDKADLRDANFSGCTMINASLASTNAIGINLSNANLSSADLSYADLSNAKVVGASFYSVRATGALVSRDLGDLLGGQTANDRLKWKVVTDASEENLWKIILGTLPRIRAMAQLMSLVDGSDSDDITSEAVMQLTALLRRGSGAIPSGDELQRFVSGVIRKIVAERRREKDRLVQLDDEIVWNGGNDVTFSGELTQQLQSALENYQLDARSADDPSSLVEAQQLLEKLIERLSIPHRQILHALIEGSSVEEIVESLQFSPNMIGRGIMTIRRAMRELYEKKIGE